MRAWYLAPAIVVCAIVVSARLQDGRSAATQPPGFFALNGAAARAFALPSDVRSDREVRVGSLMLQRYQQYAGAARVLGGQLSVYRTAAGDVSLVIGAHYPGLSSPSPGITQVDALQIAAMRGGAFASRHAELMIDPASARLFYRIESRGFDARRVHWIDASDGAVIREYDAIADGRGTGVKGDTKDLSGLTKFDPVAGHGAAGPHYDLTSLDGRQVTYDANNRQALLYFVTDDDDAWDLLTADRQSPGQPALIDAQYYAAVTDDYYADQHGFDWLACTGLPAMRSVGHYKKDYDNAFWSGDYMIYGDGDGIETREFSGELGVVAHELTHAVTDCTSALIYMDESGALNESFSDVIGANAEFYADAHGRDPAAAPDWLIGEDITLVADAAPGFRNMANPAEDGDPDHYGERQIGGVDNGGVHTNSGIPNHAYYLLVNGGQNAGCALGHAHCAGEGAVTVTGIGLVAAEQIFFLAFAGLPENATMCQARAATEAAAPVEQLPSVIDAWRSVGIADALCTGTPPTPTPTSTATSTSTPVPPTATATSTETSTPTNTLTATATSTATPVPTSTSTPTSTPVPPTATATSTETSTPTNTPTAGPDTDGDGVTDAADNCPSIANPAQTNTDGNFIDLHVFGKLFDDITVVNSDNMGDACDPDIDNDGLLNEIEAQVGPAGSAHAQCTAATGPTNPLLNDTDDDMVLDGAECALGTDPVDASSNPPAAPVGDTDHDGLTDAFEAIIGTNPALPNTDGDWLLDGVEYKGYNSNPLVLDTDGDVCSDGREAASVNDDMKVNSLDMVAVASHFGGRLSGKYIKDFDVNKDGNINSIDMLIQAKLFTSLPC